MNTSARSVSGYLTPGHTVLDAREHSPGRGQTAGRFAAPPGWPRRADAEKRRLSQFPHFRDTWPARPDGGHCAPSQNEPDVRV